jgi:hypothetical protein
VLRLGIYAIVVAIPLAVLAVLPPRVAVLITAAVLGALASAFIALTHSFERICDFTNDVTVDRCSGTYLTIMGVDHRFPPFVQGDHGYTWLIAGSAAVGALVAILLTLAAMWTLAHVRRSAVASA